MPQQCHGAPVSPGGPPLFTTPLIDSPTKKKGGQQATRVSSKTDEDLRHVGSTARRPGALQIRLGTSVRQVTRDQKGAGSDCARRGMRLVPTEF